jgi:DNA helicase II / ATP-dependent DNA helicase PcrA
MEFNIEQQTALTSSARNLLVLAGAGTGKTRTIVGRAIHLLKQGTAAERIVVLTFTRRAANELKSRLASVAGDQAGKIVAGTFHHFCLREMRSRPNWFGLERVTVMDRDDQMHMMKLVRARLVAKREHAPDSSELLAYYSYARNTNQPVHDYLQSFTDLDQKGIALVEEIFAAYRERKQVNGYVDYDDILHRFAKVMRTEEFIRKAVGERYAHILVDEMQDTNPLQWLILESLSQYAHLFCVGDDAQSIYAFRGADFRNVHSFSERLPDAETLKLEMNYRSTQEILDLSNWLLNESALKYNKQLRAVRGEGISPCLFDFDSEFSEAEWIAREIQSRHKQGTAWGEHMVLCRTGYGARPIEGEFIERKIPYRFIGGMGLLQLAHVRDLLSAVRVIVNHRDELAWIRYLILWPMIGEVTAARLIARLLECTDSAAALQELASLVKGRKDLLEPLQKLHGVRDCTAEAIAGIAASLSPHLAQKYENWDSRVRDFALLEQLATRHHSLSSFLDTYTLDPVSSSEAATGEGNDDVVTLITVHSAKGTEAKTCFVAGVVPGNFPHSRSLKDPDQVEEERRVLYVALTRAKDELFITRSVARESYRVSFNNSAGSRYFLEHLPGKLVKHHMDFGRRYHFVDDGRDHIF